MHVSLYHIIIVELRVVRCKEEVRNLHKRNAHNKEREKHTSTIRSRRTVRACSFLMKAGGRVKKKEEQQKGKKTDRTNGKKR